MKAPTRRKMRRLHHFSYFSGKAFACTDVQAILQCATENKDTAGQYGKNTYDSTRLQ